MHITVFGASGAIGQQFIQLATHHGHTIRAVYRTPPDPAPPTTVESLVHPDICDEVVVAQAIRDADVVVTTLGPSFAKRHDARSQLLSPPDLHHRLARTLVSALHQSGATPKLLTVSTASMGPADASMPLGPRLLFRFFRTVVARNLRVVGQDLMAMEQEFAQSGLEWYAVRPVKLTDGPLTEQIQAGERFALRTISRADVAWYLLTLAETRSPPALRTPILVSAPRRQPALGERDTLRSVRQESLVR